MGMISGIASNEVQLPAVSGERKAQETQKTQEAREMQETQEIHRTQDKILASRPVMDEYIPEEEREASGRYWMEKDSDGNPRIHFDDPEKDSPEICRGSTDQVDREIEKLKKEKEKLEGQIRSETDETKIRELEKKLSQIERELSQKDNDTYRRQHTVFLFS